MNRPNPRLWFVHIFKFPKSDTLRIVFKEMMILALFTLALTYVQINYIEELHILKDAIAVYSLIGFVLSLLLVFRTNTAYERWWEGRKRWGELVNNTRTLAVKVVSTTDDVNDITFFRRMIINYVYALKWHLRAQQEDLHVDLHPEEEKEFHNAAHKPSFFSTLMYTRLHQMRELDTITDNEYLTFDTNLNTFSNITGACERIQSTPMPYSYNLFMKKFIFIYVTTLPLGFVSSFGYGTILISVFIFYVLVSIELLAEEIEDPFGFDDNDLALDDICKKIDEDISNILDANDQQ